MHDEAKELFFQRLSDTAAKIDYTLVDTGEHWVLEHDDNYKPSIHFLARIDGQTVCLIFENHDVKVEGATESQILGLLLSDFLYY